MRKGRGIIPLALLFISLKSLILLAFLNVFVCFHHGWAYELAHLEIVGAVIHQLTCNLTVDQIKDAGFDTYFVDHTAGVYPQFASGMAFTTASLQSKGDPITDLHENLAAEQKARTTYDNILRLSDDPDVNNVIRFLRQREVVHYQRFGELLRCLTERLEKKNHYAFNPSFDKQ